MTLLRGYLILGWVLLVGVTVWAVTTLGIGGGKVFITDFAHAWRAQFYTDFMLHVIPITAWVFWRESSRVVGIACALGTTMGGLFTLLYVLAATYRAGGDAKRLLLGRHA